MVDRFQQSNPNSRKFGPLPSAAMTVRHIVEEGVKRARSQQATTLGSSSADQLAIMADMLDRGLVSREEFEAEKSKILRQA
ncbi:SHOCT domain-containing protein [Sphingobium cloacae]|uniref:SHOCT domain-containing protein n=1 Tax=Sphingobium cloacae TaxID=120107 RepID=UPI0009FF5D71|nr:SHOCT domain-containing protein [Sphingobium cloacae]